MTRGKGRREGRAREEGEHVREGAAHPEGEVELRACKERVVDACGEPEAAGDGAPKETETDRVQGREDHTYCAIPGGTSAGVCARNGACSPDIMASALLASNPTLLSRWRKGVESHASRTLPTNERGTAPGKTKWSYCERRVYNVSDRWGRLNSRSIGNARHGGSTGARRT